MRAGGRPRRRPIGPVDGEAHRSAASRATRALVPASRSLTRRAVATVRPCDARELARDRPGSGDDHGAGGHDQRSLGRALEDAAADQVVQPAGPGQGHAGPDDGASTDEHAVEQHAAGPDERVVLDDDRAGPGRLEDAADGDPGREVDALADLRARADEHVRVDHRVRPRRRRRR